MADEKRRNGEESPEEKESQEGDLGSLPPLSDFESSEGGSDSGQPAKDEPDADLDSDLGGLPPISDIPVETPVPTGGNVRPAPPGYERGRRGEGAQTPSEGDSGFETPSSDPGTGFHDLAADSDFTPETPEIGPGPDSDIETPMFDSAFGAGDSSLDTPSQQQTSAPTQAMETPMFGQSGQPAAGRQGASGMGFDDDAFGSGGQGFDLGTPAPDFSPDTAGPTQMTPPPAGVRPAPAPRGGGSGMAILVGIIMLIVGLAVGVFSGGYFTKNVVNLPFNPWATELENAQREIASLRQTNQELVVQNNELREMKEELGVAVSIEEIERMQEEVRQLSAQLETLRADVGQEQAELDRLTREVELKNEEYAVAEQDYESLLNLTAIERARRDGLLSETDRLETQVGRLEEADARRMQTKKALEHAVDLLVVEVREGIPLTPAKYARDARLDAVERLRAKVESANWVDPELLNEYTSLYMAELAIAQSREYFFAKVPVADRFGVRGTMWAECVMNGNWSVYYRTIDGAHIGVYENIASSGTPRYEFRDHTVKELRANVEKTIAAMRTPDYQQKIAALVEKQTIVDHKSEGQRLYDSL